MAIFTIIAIIAAMMIFVASPWLFMFFAIVIGFFYVTGWFGAFCILFIGALTYFSFKTPSFVEERETDCVQAGFNSLYIIIFGCALSIIGYTIFA